MIDADFYQIDDFFSAPVVESCIGQPIGLLDGMSRFPDKE